RSQGRRLRLGRVGRGLTRHVRCEISDFRIGIPHPPQSINHLRSEIWDLPSRGETMKVSIIGGGGLVGSCAAFALQCGGVASGLDLIDVNGDLCRGQALDLLHGSSIAADQRIRATGYEAIPESDLVCITAGLRRKPDESRLYLINRNVELFLNILGQVKAAGPKKSAIVLV